MQNLRMMGKNDGPIYRRLWAKVREILDTVGTLCSFQRRSSVVCIQFQVEQMYR